MSPWLAIIWWRLSPPPLRLESRKPLWRDLLTIDVTSRWREDWQSATVVNSTLVVDPTIRLPGFDLHRRQGSLLNRFRTGQGHCNACHKKWGFTDNELCDCGEIKTVSHIVNSCPLSKFDGGHTMIIIIAKNNKQARFAAMFNCYNISNATLQGLHLLFPYITKRVVNVGSVDDIVTLLSSDYPFIQRMSKVTQDQLNSFGN